MGSAARKQPVFPGIELEAGSGLVIGREPASGLRSSHPHVRGPPTISADFSVTWTLRLLPKRDVQSDFPLLQDSSPSGTALRGKPPALRRPAAFYEYGHHPAKLLHLSCAISCPGCEGSPGYSTCSTNFDWASALATSIPFRLCRSIRQGNVRNPRRISQALNGDPTAPRTIRVWNSCSYSGSRF